MKKTIIAIVDRSELAEQTPEQKAVFKRIKGSFKPDPDSAKAFGTCATSVFDLRKVTFTGVKKEDLHL